jgi:hypothetical protein
MGTKMDLSDRMHFKHAPENAPGCPRMKRLRPLSANATVLHLILFCENTFKIGNGYEGNKRIDCS